MRLGRHVCALLLAASPLQAQEGGNLRGIAEKVSVGVATTKDVHEGSRGRPVFILEEHHNSREVQIQSAVCLVRLYGDYGLRDVALEGYLLEDEPITTEWYAEAAGHDADARTRVAIQLLKEGEISCAEFVALIYDDCKLHPIDKKAEYTANPGARAQAAPKMYLVRLGEMKADVEKRNAILDELRAANAAFRKADDDGDKKLREEKRAEVLASLNEYYEYVISADPWAWDVYQKLKNNTDWVLSERLRLIRSIEQRVAEVGAKLQDEEKEMQAWVAWLHGRDRASTTMALETARIAQKERLAGPVGMILGAAHTDDVVRVLGARGCPSVRVTPNARSKGGDVAMVMFERKEKGLSIFSEGLTEILLQEFGTADKKKPRPVLMEPWFQAKAELYLLVDRVAHAMFEPPGLPDGGGGPPFGLNNEDFSGRRVAIDVSRMQVVPYNSRGGDCVYRITGASLRQLREAGLTEKELEALTALKNSEYVGEETFLAQVEGAIGEKRTEEHKGTVLEAAELKAVVFPVILNHRSQSKRKEIWAKASLNREVVSAKERADVEAMLMEALEEVAKQGLLNETKVEDAAGRVQLSLDTIAAFDTSADGAVDISLGI